MVGGILWKAAPDAELIEPYPAVLLNNRIDCLNELCSFYFDTILIVGLLFGAIKGTKGGVSRSFSTFSTQCLSLQPLSVKAVTIQEVEFPVTITRVKF
jgi:hypothetical protein